MKRTNRKDFILAAILIAAGLAVSGISLPHLASRNQQMAQTTQPMQSSPASPAVPSGKDNGPAESMPGGTRPTTPAPEPARPSLEAEKAGGKPALPPEPFEKMGKPVQK